MALTEVLERGGFDLERIEGLEPGFSAHDEAGHVHHEHCGHDPYDHAHDAQIQSVCLSSTAPMDGAAVSEWLTALVAEQGANILRAKGIVGIHGEPRRMVFQAVHMLLEGEFQRPWKAGEARSSRLVFIGRHLDAPALQTGFDGCAAVENAGPENL